jgi:UDP-GlcNAc3NAcA epimerase
MLKIITIIGARPQIIKAAAISRAIKNYFSHQIQEVIVHTGQHYDATMSQVFFEELEIPTPHYNLNSGSGTHGLQTGKMIIALEEVLLKEQPDALLLYGDTNSTLAGSIVASKLHIPIIHIEGGVRSGKKNIPEELNRITCDHLSTLIFVPTESGMQNLKHEGFNLEPILNPTITRPNAYYCGDIMYDNSLYFKEKALQKSKILEQYHLIPDSYYLATVHRDINTDNLEHLSAIFKAFLAIANLEMPLVLPLHPRTKKALQNLEPNLLSQILETKHLILIEPASFLEMTALEANAQLILTDSGGVQKEAYYFNKPCVILVEETAWKELEPTGCASLTGANTQKITDAVAHFNTKKTLLNFPPIFGDGRAAEFIIKKIIENFNKS